VVFEPDNGFTVLKNRFGDTLERGTMDELPDYIERWEIEHKEWMKIPSIDLKVHTKTVKGGSLIKYPANIGIKLSSPKGFITGSITA
jgi:hypothetical protein